MDAPKRSRPFILLLRRFWTCILNMDVTQLDVFRHCRCLRHVGKVMVLFVLGLVACIYYSTVTSGIAPGLHSGQPGVAGAAVLGFLLYTALVALVLWSYLACFLTQPGHVPHGWHPFHDAEARPPRGGSRADLCTACLHPCPADARAAVKPVCRAGSIHPRLSPAVQQAAAELEAWEQLAYEQQQRRQPEWGLEAGRAHVSRPRYCRKCKAWKPPRAHHDSMTGRCVLKMDHYCIWVLNCVGLLNYKFFALFLLYACAACTASAALLVRPCIAAFRSPGPSVGGLVFTFVCFVFSVAFSLALLGFVVMHARLCALNMSTIEAYEKRPVKPWPYDRGRAANLMDVFGRDRRYWLLPMHAPHFTRSLLEDALRIPPAPDQLLEDRETV